MSKYKGLKADMPPTTPPTPRSMDEINRVYEELCKRAGAVQYRMSVDAADLERLNEALLNVNNEAAARQQLDAKSQEESK